MPELPEVETIKEMLKKELLNKKIVAVKVYWDKIISYPTKEEFIKKIKGQIITDIKRAGKWLIIVLTDYNLFCHLRMEGKFFIKEHNAPKGKHDHVIFVLEDKSLYYNDVRKFGQIKLIAKEVIDIRNPLTKIGLDAFDDKLTSSYLKEKFKRKIIPIKSTLLDQSIIAGIGNIYADEILFLSKINPLTPTNKVTIKKIKLLIDNMRLVLSQAILMGGTTVRTYTSSLGVTGRFQQELLVYGRKGKPCKHCKAVIKKRQINGRGTHYCPNCQKMR